MDRNVRRRWRGGSANNVGYTREAEKINVGVKLRKSQRFEYGVYHKHAAN